MFPSTTQTLSTMFETTQAWFGTIRTRSPGFRRRGAAHAHGGVLFRQPLDDERRVGRGAVDRRHHDPVSGCLTEPAREIVRERLAAGVEDETIRGGPAHDAGEHGERAVVPRRAAEADLRAVVVDVIARAQLGQPGQPGAEPRGRRRADAHLPPPARRPLRPVPSASSASPLPRRQWRQAPARTPRRRRVPRD